MNRKRHFSFVLFLLLCCVSLTALAAGNYTFMLATDLHYISPGLTDHGAYFTAMIAAGDGKVTAYCDELTQAFVEEVVSAAPDALILAGDLTFNGARQSHEDLVRRLTPIREAGIPVFVIPGNHDMNNYSAASFSGPSFTRVESMTPEGFSALYNDLATAVHSRAIRFRSAISPSLRRICAL